MVLHPLPPTRRNAQGDPPPSVLTLLSPRLPPLQGGLSPPYQRLALAEATHAMCVLPPPPLALEKRKRCGGAYGGNCGAALSLAGRALLTTGQELLRIATDRDGGFRSFANSALATSKRLCLPYRKINVERLSLPEEVLFSDPSNATGPLTAGVGGRDATPAM